MTKWPCVFWSAWKLNVLEYIKHFLDAFKLGKKYFKKLSSLFSFFLILKETLPKNTCQNFQMADLFIGTDPCYEHPETQH